MQPSDPLDDPLRNLWVGVIRPIIMALFVAALILAVALVAALYLGHWAWFFVTALALFFIERKLHNRASRARENEAAARFWGVKPPRWLE